MSRSPVVEIGSAGGRDRRARSGEVREGLADGVDEVVVAVRREEGVVDALLIAPAELQTLQTRTLDIFLTHIHLDHSFGLTTLRDRHVRTDGSKVQFRFRGKSGVHHAVEVHDRRLANIIRRMRDLPGQELFQYEDDDGKPVPGLVQETLRNLREIAPTVYFNVPKGFEELAAAMEQDEVLRHSLFSRVKAFFFAGSVTTTKDQPCWLEPVGAWIARSMHSCTNSGGTGRE